ncbi:EamA family transporter [Streptomyces sp. NRRL F-5135]|uniref:EamA family transporter n=1 Tax=Streptomyces sp. NRRL F-5135 TaxID=1463858 RepID=UPI00099B9B89|nr:EamA family transporter [Streptomyces sp. NRRL F-5135]
MHGRQGRSVGLGLALASAFAFGGSGVAAKPLIEAGLDPLHVVWLRVTGAAVVMLPVAWRHRALLRRSPTLLAGFGLFAVAGVQACYFAAVARIPVGVALLIEYLGPALVLLWVRFVQRRPVTRAAAVGVVLAVGGLACVVEVWSGLGFDPWGVLLALGAAFCQVSYFLLADHGGSGGAREAVGDTGERAEEAERAERTDRVEPTERADPLGVVAYGLLVGAVVLTLVARPWGMDRSVLSGDVDLGTSRVPALLLLGWVVLIATVLAYTTGVLAVRGLSPQVAGVVACLEAVVATVLAWVLLREHLALPQILGGALVLTGAFIAQSTTPKAPSGPVAGGPGKGAVAIGGGAEASGVPEVGGVADAGGDRVPLSEERSGP